MPAALSKALGVCALVVAGLAIGSIGVVGAGCAANGVGTDPDGTEDPPVTDDDPSATTKPAPPTFDATIDPDAGDNGGEATDTDGGGGGPTGPGSCKDTDDAPSSETLAKALPTIDDCDSSQTSVPGVVDGTVDVDYFKWQGNDTFGCEVNPHIETATSGVEVCVYVSCLSGTTTLNDCGDGTKATSDTGNPGCCITSPGAMDPAIDCPGTDDSAEMFMKVSETSNACTPYSITYHF